MIFIRGADVFTTGCNSRFWGAKDFHWVVGAGREYRPYGVYSYVVGTSMVLYSVSNGGEGVVVRGILVTGHNRVTIHIVHSYGRVNVHAITIFSRTSHATHRIVCTSRTYLVKPTTSGRDCLGVSGVVGTTERRRTSTVRPNCNFLSRGTSFTHQYGRRKVVFVNPTTRAVRTVNSGVTTHGHVVTTNIPMIPNARRPLRDTRRTMHVYGRVNCPIVLGTSVKNNNGKVELVRDRSRIIRTCGATHSRSVSSFKSSAICLRGFIRRPRRVRFRVLNSGRNGMVRLFSHRYSIRHHGRGVMRRDPSPFLAPRLHRRVKRGTMTTTETIGCSKTKAVRFLISGGHGFCFLRVGAHLRIRRPVARRIINISLIGRRVHVTGSRILRLGRRRLCRHNRTVRYHVYTRSARGGFVPSPNVVGRLARPGNVNMHVSDCICRKCRVPIFCSPVVNGLVI